MLYLWKSVSVLFLENLSLKYSYAFFTVLSPKLTFFMPASDWDFFRVFYELCENEMSHNV